MKWGNYSSRKLFILLLFLVIFVVMLSDIWKYDLRGHKWGYMYQLVDLPEKYRAMDKQEKKPAQIWHLGARYALVDVQEPYLKSYRGGKVIDNPGYYQILHYNEEANMDFNLDNKILKDTCAYQNCHFTSNRTQLRSSSAVLFALSHGKTRLKAQAPPKVPGQVWIFFEREPPIIGSMFGHRHESWKNMMNWSMTHRFDSDIVFPYGTLVSRKPSDIPKKDYGAIYRQKTKFAFWIVSNCKSMVFSARNEFVQELSKYVPVDIYGACGTEVTDGQVPELFKQYKFYLSLENTLCKWYVTEKFFVRYPEDIVLVTRGGADYDRLFPSGTFIDAGNFMNPASLAQHLLRINASEKMYTDILRNKDKYGVAPHVNWQCQLCAKLNNQKEHQRVYESIVSYYFVDVCWKARDVIPNSSKLYIVMALFVLVLVSFIYFKSRLNRNNECLLFGYFTRLR